MGPDAYRLDCRVGYERALSCVDTVAVREEMWEVVCVIAPSWRVHSDLLTIAISSDNTIESQARPGTPVTRRLTQMFRCIRGALQAIIPSTTLRELPLPLTIPQLEPNQGTHTPRHSQPDHLLRMTATGRQPRRRHRASSYPAFALSMKIETIP
jgi:hypothetical protein